MPVDGQIDRTCFLAMLLKRFPEVAETLDEVDEGLIHLEVAAFRRCVEIAMDEGKLGIVEKYLAFVHKVLPLADSSLENALEVSFIEDLALGHISDIRKAALRDRSPRPLRDKIIAINADWR